VWLRSKEATTTGIQIASRWLKKIISEWFCTGGGSERATMPEENSDSQSEKQGWTSAGVYVMAAVCLLVGVLLGYLVRGSQSPQPPKPADHTLQALTSPPTTDASVQQAPTLEQMKHMADKKAEPLLAKLKTDPKNASLLVQLGKIYEATHQFPEAARYYRQALAIDPGNVAIRTEMASCLYYAGDVEGAISQLQQAVEDNPKDANSLFNLGVIKWKGKQDAKGAVAAWQQLLDSNPDLSDDRKAQVKKLIAEVQPQVHRN
jgi:cytochrome c-type biogenesis protein CcmH/NrfG